MSELSAVPRSRVSAVVQVDGTDLSIEQVAALAQSTARIELSRAPAFMDRIDRGARFLEQLWQEEGVIYGVTTGYGDSCTVAVPPDLVETLPHHLYRFHGCGLGDHFDATETRAILAARLISLARGYSGVRYALLDQLAALLDHDILPLIPQEGSVGASGDLTPLSYVAAVLAGEGRVRFQGREQTAAEAWAAIHRAPLMLRPKEGLAIMNGTAAMTGLACLAFQRAAYLTQLSARITALNSIALAGNAAHYDAELFAVKPHPGQGQVAAWIAEDLGLDAIPRQSSRLQDRYSLRCAPHVIGVLSDALPWLRSFVETELNSANDNPIVDPDRECVLHGGHFYGGHIALAMDSLKNAVANIADLLDRQLAQLVDTKFNHGLPANLSGAEGVRAAINHGFKAVQIGVSAWTAEALKGTMPASVFSRSTECHNQDKVSMGTIAARDCLRILTLTEQVAAAALLAAIQGVELRQRLGDLPQGIRPPLAEMIAEVRAISPFLEEDRALESELRAVIITIRERRWRLYETV